MNVILRFRAVFYITYWECWIEKLENRKHFHASLGGGCGANNLSVYSDIQKLSYTSFLPTLNAVGELSPTLK